jgi:hypothetical protein
LTVPEQRKKKFADAWDAMAHSRWDYASRSRRWLLDALYGRKCQPAQPFLDPDWRSRLPNEFAQRFWELFVAAAFLEEGAALVPSRTPDGPDLTLLTNGLRCHIECVAPGAGVDGNPDRVPEPPGGMIAEAVPVEAIQLRVAQSLREKTEQMKKRLKRGITKADEPYWIALNIRGAAFHRGDTMPPYVVRVAFGMGPFAVAVDPRSFEASESFVQEEPHLTRTSGAIVQKGVIGSRGNAPRELTGILFADVDAFNHPGLGGLPLRHAFHYVPNPFSITRDAMFPIPVPTFVAQVEDDRVIGYRLDPT